MAEKRLENRIALITGGGRGLGKAMALRMAREGANLVLASPDAEELEETAAEVRGLGRRALVSVTDVADERQVKIMAAAARSELGIIDILVNNAGVIGPTAPVAKVKRGDWDHVLAVNLTGAMLCCREVIPGMTERGRGKIINISSIAGRIGYELRSPYCVSKWGIIGLTLTLAKELAEHDIHVNAVCPGPVEGPRMEQVFEQKSAETGRSKADIRKEYEAQALLKRLVRAEDIAAMTAFLASHEADNITGQVLEVSAGYGL